MLFRQEQQKTSTHCQFNTPLASGQPRIEVFEEEFRQSKLPIDAPLEQKTTLIETTHSEQQTQYWLLWLAAKSKQDDSTQFLIESIQPSWLESPQQKRLYQITLGIITGLLIGLIYGMSTGWIGAIVGGGTYGFISGRTQAIYPVESLKLSFEHAKVKFLSSILEGLWWGLVYGLIDALICGFLWGLEGMLWGMGQVVVWGLVEGLIWGLSVPEFKKVTVSNQGIKDSANNAVFFTFIGGGAWALLYVLVLELMGEPLELKSLLVDSISSGLFFGIYIGGLACLQHFVLRLILWRNGCIPWNYAKFLNYATELGFLEREGGSYRFNYPKWQENLEDVTAWQGNYTRKCRDNFRFVYLSQTSQSSDGQCSASVESVASRFWKTKLRLLAHFHQPGYHHWRR